jgi:hypothetical protein
MDNLDNFEDWLRYQQVDLRGAPHTEVEIWRDQYERVLAQAAQARSIALFSQPTPAGEFRHAVAIREGRSALRLALVFRRSPKSEFFILYPRARDWDPHSSYHRNGHYHHKSCNQKGPVHKRQPLDGNFRGTEHLGAFYGVGTGVPICFAVTLLRCSRPLPTRLMHGAPACSWI